ncbi:pyrroloquinoline quinone biosynthesis protein PqqB [Enterovibrio norvegicus FF-162]|uniref:pyrroloquinoline quinone biosynthesis protein PqqB n=1 Tax=Enterovibrio TaxID=188143 RepID=UPI0002DB2140|nr:pyrroloquinoline quinone biosynthesis protein PqqB [Enterovibrio norvegicus]OEE81524.1 pyrroloquinoline quinone biosynthesis protein PqqB [Enterovibrio norvegicus FF-162]
MQIVVLGSAAGGGFPQWNCHCRMCQSVRNGTSRALPRTQSSIAVSDDGENWVVINTSPDIRQQINATPQLAKADGSRGSAIRAVIVTDAQIDHTTGLLILREGLPLDLYCTPEVEQELSSSYPILSMMKHWEGGYRTHTIDAQSADGWHIPAVPALRFTPITLTSNAPPFSPFRHRPRPGDNIGLKITDTRSGKSLFYAPGLGVKDDPAVLSALADADCVMIDGTLWTDDEMIREGLGESLGSDMGHLSVSGENGMLALLAEYEKPRKVLIHINNTNPILDPDSSEHQAVLDAGVDIAFDGMEMTV